MQFNRLLELLEKGAATPAIEREMTAIEPAVWREWRKVILAAWHRDADDVAPYAKDHMRQVLWRAFSEAYDSGDMKSAVTCLDKLCKLDGLYEAQKIESIVNDSKSLSEAKDRLVELLQSEKVRVAALGRN